jgi:hypothetical protein
MAQCHGITQGFAREEKGSRLWKEEAQWLSSHSPLSKSLALDTSHITPEVRSIASIADTLLKTKVDATDQK